MVSALFCHGSAFRLFRAVSMDKSSRFYNPKRLRNAYHAFLPHFLNRFGLSHLKSSDKSLVYWVGFLDFDRIFLRFFENPVLSVGKSVDFWQEFRWIFRWIF
jgi:hypothetical protein